MTRDDEVFADALDQPASERAAFLGRACAGDEALRARIGAMLALHDEASGFLELPLATRGVVLPEEKPGDLIGRYKLLQKIGEGGMGVVYLAEQEGPVRRRVALKIIKLGMDTKSVVARFEAERAALALMDHPNIARVFDGGATDAGRPYFVMELVRGVRITDYCDEARLATRDRLDLFIQVCQAIQHAHQKGIIHRDIKPSNILVTVNDGVAVPKVIDFGIAKAIEGRLTDRTLVTQFEALIGTPAYMSPEQTVMTSVDIDTRCDIYSLGVLLYEMLTGRTPFDTKELLASGLDAMRKTIREQEPVRPSTRLATLQGEELTTTARRRSVDTSKLLHQLQGDLDWIVIKCLEKDRGRRYETANGLATDLKRHLNNEPIGARPPSTRYRFQKAFRRNAVVFTAAAVVAVALVAGIGVSTWQMFEARKAQRAAEVARNGEQQQRREAQSAQKVAETEQQRADAQARNASESRQHARRLLYASDMNLAQQALKRNNLGRARRLLDRHRPQPAEEDLRGWEWRYLWQLTRSSALVTLTNQPVRGFSVSFSPDGSLLAVGWGNGRVDLWDVPARRLVRALTDREAKHPAQVAFSPTRNLLAATSEPKMVALYDLDAGREWILWRAPDESDWSVRDLAFSEDSSRLVIYAGSTRHFGGDAVWVVNVSSSRIESHHPTTFSQSRNLGAARLSPDSQRLYFARSDAANYRCSIQCVDLNTGRELWETERERDYGLTTLAVSPDGRVLASGSGFEDHSIRVWDTATGRLLRRLDGHTSSVVKLTFTRDGRRLISAAGDQSIRFWDTSNWTETRVLRGHTDEVHAVAISETAQLLASASKNGDIMLWNENEKSGTDGYTRLSDNLRSHQVWPLNDSRVLLLPPGQPPELVNLTRDSRPAVVPEIASSTNVLGWFDPNIICHWDGTSRILVHELRGVELIQRGAIALGSPTRPRGVTYNAAHQLLAWTEGLAATSVYLVKLPAPGRRIELRSDVPGLVPFRLSANGKYLVAKTERADCMRAWNIETGEIVASAEGLIYDVAFAAGDGVLAITAKEGINDNHRIGFYDLLHPERAPRQVPGRYYSFSLAVSPDSGLVASSTGGGLVRLFDPSRGEVIESLHGHLNAIYGLAFSADGRRLISASGSPEAIKLWDVGTRQELLTLRGTGSILLTARWSADGNVIMAGSPCQVWRAPSWEEIAAAEAKEKTAIKQDGRQLSRALGP